MVMLLIHKTFRTAFYLALIRQPFFLPQLLLPGPTARMQGIPSSRDPLFRLDTPSSTADQLSEAYLTVNSGAQKILCAKPSVSIFSPKVLIKVIVPGRVT